MSVCHGCGGVVGRDCFNPQECEQITQSMAEQFPQASQDVAELLAECDKLNAENERMKQGVSYWSYCMSEGMRSACPEKVNELADFLISCGVAPHYVERH